MHKGVCLQPFGKLSSLKRIQIDWHDPNRFPTKTYKHKQTQNFDFEHLGVKNRTVPDHDFCISWGPKCGTFLIKIISYLWHKRHKIFFYEIKEPKIAQKKVPPFFRQRIPQHDITDRFCFCVVLHKNIAVLRQIFTYAPPGALWFHKPMSVDEVLSRKPPWTNCPSTPLWHWWGQRMMGVGPGWWWCRLQAERRDSEPTCRTSRSWGRGPTPGHGKKQGKPIDLQSKIHLVAFHRWQRCET